MSKTNIILLLQLIYAGGDVNSLLQRGLQFSQIAALITQAEEKKYILEKENELKLTDLGLIEMRKELPSNKIRKDGGWISPLDEYRVEKLDVYEVYLPSSKKVLSLLRKSH